MRERLASALCGHNADYLEAHLEESEVTQVRYENGGLEEVHRTRSCGGNIRALVSGGWGFVSFEHLDDLWSRAALAVEQARLASGDAVPLVTGEAAVDKLAERPERDAASLPLERKKQVLDEYNDIILGTARVQNARIDYHDARRTVVFANSEGSYIEQDRPDLTLRLTAVARENNEIQQAGLSLGSKGDFSAIEGLHQQARETAGLAAALLSAPEVRGGEYTVILDPVLAGVFAHEAFGHLSESDFVYQNRELQDIMTLGRTFGGRNLNIVDDATVPGLRGSYQYDDEGMRARRTYLIREGVLVGRLHSRETAARMGEKATGNARAVSCRFPPIVRMSNTFIENGTMSFEEMLSGVRKGLYVKNWYGGQTSLEMFTFSAGEAYMIRGGRLAELVRPVVLTGNVFTTLNNIDAIGGDLEMNQGGGCGKGGQSPLPVSNGSPHIRIRHCLIGGR